MPERKKTLTVFTATYNRGHLIERLYRSLLRQSCFDFEWLVIDDGSEDNTKELFSEWLNADNPFTIRYYYQPNQGLIRALNLGIELAQGEYFAKIDSDDYVVDDFSEKMITWINQIRNEEKVYGVSGVRVSPEGIPLKGSWPQMPDDSDYVDATDLERAAYNLDADMCESWRTDVLRQHPFPVWDGEKFAPEQIVFFDIALEGWKIRWFPVAMLICEYQEGGLTLGASKLEKQNPMGYAMMYNQKLKYLRGIKQRMKAAMQCNALCFVGGYPQYIFQSNALLMSLLTLIPGWLLSYRRRIQYREVNQ
ncbi:MAG: glycosyltransferase family 2 protein [Oscillospiraceae bacterium]|nr:glycosyltransferase family 2 protein [Oscillospiraceae bacterium]